MDYAGPVHIKYGHVRVIKAYVFVLLSVKAVHLEAVSDLTIDALIAALQRFVARRGKPTHIWSDHGSNFVGANREFREMYDFRSDDRPKLYFLIFCSTQNISWRTHFGGLWEAAVKTIKRHLRKIVSNIKLSWIRF